MSIYVRFFKKKDYEVLKRPVWSTYFPNNLCEAIFHNNIEEDEYILCPYYSDGDFQIGVTGSIAKNESYKEGVLRELGEEIGLKPRYSPADIEFLSNGKMTLGKNRTTKDKRMSVYMVDILDLKPLTNTEHNKKKQTAKDSNNKKVGCIVYGDKKTILNFLSMDDIYRYYSTDKLKGIVAIKISEVRKYVIKKHLC
jgi:ADP-ribose pyrophosphatase YjhB (NUDIX family)